MSVVRCRLSYKKYKIADLPIFAQGVKNGVYGNADTFPSPPESEGDFQDAISAYVDTRALYENGGSDQKPAWEMARTKLLSGLDNMAVYVDSVASGNELTVILSGFVPTKSGSSEIAKPTKLSGVKLVRTEVSGSLNAYCSKQDGVNSYVCILTEGALLPAGFTVSGQGQLIYQNIEGNTSLANALATSALTAVFIDLNQSRYKAFQDLVPLKTYYCVFVGINAGGVGPLSDPISIICV